jgi:hypothetical protein
MMNDLVVRIRTDIGSRDMAQLTEQQFWWVMNNWKDYAEGIHRAIWKTVPLHSEGEGGRSEPSEGGVVVELGKEEWQHALSYR